MPMMVPLVAAAALAPQVTRRGILSAAAAAALPLTPYSTEAVDVTLPTQARVAVSPAIQYLEPIYELRLSVDALNSIASDEARWPALKKRLDRFFSGGPLSEKIYYLGLNLQYLDKIRYDDLDAFVRQDKAERKQAFEDAIAALEDCRKALSSDAPEKSAVAGAAAKAKASLSRWFEFAPVADVERVGRLFVAVRNADTDRNGKLSAAELATLDPADAATWKARVALVGD